MNGGLIKTDADKTITEVYAYNVNETNPQNVTITETKNYNYFDDSAGTYVLGISLNHFFGWLITIIGALGFAISLGSIRNKEGLNNG